VWVCVWVTEGTDGNMVCGFVCWVTEGTDGNIVFCVTETINTLPDCLLIIAVPLLKL
jgi:hypothetical protein